MYEYLKDNIQWEQGIRSARTGSTRMAKSLKPDQDPLVAEFLFRALKATEFKSLILLGLYLNYYRDGTDHTPAHSHPKQVQIIISLGATRTLIVGKKTYTLKNGDVIVFGSSTHSVPAEPEVKEGRISIATFSLQSNSQIESLIGGLRGLQV